MYYVGNNDGEACYRQDDGGCFYSPASSPHRFSNQVSQAEEKCIPENSYNRFHVFSVFNFGKDMAYNSTYQIFATLFDECT